MSNIAPTVEKPKRRFWSLFLWALGIRKLGADNEYGPALAHYRRWSRWPVSVLSILVFVLIATKLTIVVSAFMAAFQQLDPQTVVMQHSLHVPTMEIIMSTMTGLMGAVIHAIPFWLTITLWLSWLLAFVVDFIVCAVLATHKNLWWKRHWAGLITTIITFP